MSSDAFEVGSILKQEDHPIALFSKQLNEAHQQCSIHQQYFTYDRELYIVVQTLCYW